MAFKCFFILAAITMLATIAVAAPGNARDTEDDMETKILSDLAIRAARLAQMSPFGYRGGLSTAYAKRNSELINSLLGLPKVMTDAGRK